MSTVITEYTPRNLISINPTSTILFALVSAIAYYFLRNITSNKYVVIGIGLALVLLTQGSLADIGLGVLALGISRLMEQEINKIESSG